MTQSDDDLQAQTDKVLNLPDDEREEMAADHCSDQTVLRVLAYDKSSEVRKRVAANPSVPADILKMLVKDHMRKVCIAAIGNKKMSSETLQSWSQEAEGKWRVELIKELHIRLQEEKFEWDEYGNRIREGELLRNKK